MWPGCGQLEDWLSLRFVSLAWQPGLINGSPESLDTAGTEKTACSLGSGFTDKSEKAATDVIFLLRGACSESWFGAH